MEDVAALGSRVAVLLAMTSPHIWWNAVSLPRLMTSKLKKRARDSPLHPNKVININGRRRGLINKPVYTHYSSLPALSLVEGPALSVVEGNPARPERSRRELCHMIIILPDIRRSIFEVLGFHRKSNVVYRKSYIFLNNIRGGLISDV